MKNNSNVEILNFKSYSFEKIREDFGNKLFEKIAFFLTIAYGRSLILNNLDINNQSIESDVNCYWSNKELRAVIGKLTYIQVITKLNSKQLIKTDYKGVSKYDANKSYSYINLSSEFFKSPNNIISSGYIKNEIYKKRLNKYYAENVSYNDNDNLLLKIQETLRKVKLDIPDILKVGSEIIKRKEEEVVNGLENQFNSAKGRKQLLSKQQSLKERDKWMAYWANYQIWLQRNIAYENIYLKNSFLNLNEQRFGKRISHVFSNAPKEIRRHITIDNTATCEFDIRSSQPFFLYVLMKFFDDNNRFPEVKVNYTISYISTFERTLGKGPNFYTLIGAMLRRFRLERNEIKTLFYRLIYGDPSHAIKDHKKKELCEEIIGSGFYEFLQAMAKKKLKTLPVDKLSKNLVCALQRTESDFMRDFMTVLFENDVQAIPIYDCVIVKRTDKDKVEELIRYFVNMHPAYKGIKFKSS